MKAFYLKSVVVFIFVYGFAVNGAAQNRSDTSGIKTDCKVDKIYLKSYWKDFKGVIASPVHWSKGEYIAAGSIIATGALLYSRDKQIAEFFRAHQTKGLDNLNKYFFDPYGKMYYTIPLMAGFYIYGASAGKSKPKAVAMDFVKASVYSGVIVTVMKHITHRHRPFQTNPLNPYLWDGPFTDDPNHTSFSSGHTIMSWTFASVLANHYRKNLWIPITVYSLATLEGIARMYADKHWSTDVLIGAALGYAIGTYTVRHSNCNINVSPVIGTNFMGLGVKYTID